MSFFLTQLVSIFFMDLMVRFIKSQTILFYIYDGQTPKKPINFNSNINIVILNTQGKEWRFIQIYYNHFYFTIQISPLLTLCV